MTALAPLPTADLEVLAPLADAARGLIEAAKAPSTVRNARTNWRMFEEWCAQRGVASLPAAPEVVAMYLADLGGVLATGTIALKLRAVRQAHEAASVDDPTAAPVVRETWRGLRRTFGTAQHGKAPARTVELRSMLAGIDPSTTIGARDRALLLLGFAAALRRSELVALDVADLVEREDGLVVTIRRSKTDQEAQGTQLGVPWGQHPETCPVEALRAWYAVSGITEGPVFRPVDRWGNIATGRLSGQAVAGVVKRHAATAGLDPALFAGHSLRAGLITSAAEADVHERHIMAQSRHRSLPMMRRYIRGATLFRDNAAAAVGL